MSQRTLIQTVGLPRSGKSTWAKATGFPVVNPDAIRHGIHGQHFLERAEPLVWAVTALMIRSLFLAGHKTVVLDATNTTRERRQRFCDPLWSCEYKVFETPAEECVRRAARSGRPDLLPVIDQMARRAEGLHPDERPYTEPAAWPKDQPVQRQIEAVLPAQDFVQFKIDGNGAHVPRKNNTMMARDLFLLAGITNPEWEKYRRSKSGVVDVIYKDARVTIEDGDEFFSSEEKMLATGQRPPRPPKPASWTPAADCIDYTMNGTWHRMHVTNKMVTAENLLPEEMYVERDRHCIWRQTEKGPVLLPHTSVFAIADGDEFFTHPADGSPMPGAVKPDEPAAVEVGHGIARPQRAHEQIREMTFEEGLEFFARHGNVSWDVASLAKIPPDESQLTAACNHAVSIAGQDVRVVSAARKAVHQGYMRHIGMS